MKIIGKVITGSIVALALAGAISPSPAFAVGFFSENELGAAHSSKAPHPTPSECSYFLGCPDSLRPAAHARIVMPGITKDR